MPSPPEASPLAASGSRDQGERIQKVLAHAGVASRRAVEDMIRAGRITLNGAPAPLGARVDPAKDVIEVDGRPLRASAEKHLYLLLNKPRSVVSTLSDPQGRRTVADLLPPLTERLYPVGRLDYDSEGLLLFTNDGELTNELLHPGHEVWKTYSAEVEGIPRPAELEVLARGVQLDGRPTMPARFRLSETDSVRKRSVVEVRLCEGRKQQIRRMLAGAGYPVRRLRRTAFGPISDAQLASGVCRELTGKEITSLKKAVLNKSSAPREAARDDAAKVRLPGGQ